MSAAAPTADAFVRAAIAAGVDLSRDPRHIAHEVCHGIAWGVKRPWTNDRIHAAAMRKRPGDRLQGEVEARAVERLVCARLGVSPDTARTPDLRAWALVTLIESARNGLDVPMSVDDLADAIVRAMSAPKVLSLAERVLGIAAEGA